MSRSKSTNSTAPSKDSNKRWPKPKTLKEFSSQVNEVALLVLNDGIDLEKARVYSSLVRVIAQTVSTEVTRARFTKITPDLDFVDNGDD